MFSAAVAVGMVAVMFGKMVALHTVVMGDLGPNGGLIELPPMHSQHFHSMLQVRVESHNVLSSSFSYLLVEAD